MNIDQLRKLCLSFPGATEQTVWEGDLTFKVANKMFAHTVLEVAPVWISFKASPENFAELTEHSGVIPAPRPMGRARTPRRAPHRRIEQIAARILRFGGCETPQENPRSPLPERRAKSQANNPQTASKATQTKKERQALTAARLPGDLLLLELRRRIKAGLRPRILSAHHLPALRG